VNQGLRWRPSQRGERAEDGVTLIEILVRALILIIITSVSRALDAAGQITRLRQQRSQARAIAPAGRGSTTCSGFRGGL